MCRLSRCSSTVSVGNVPLPSANKLVFPIMSIIGVILDPDKWSSDGITAAATASIAVFTIVLVIVTNRQAKLTAASVAIAKDALLKTERAFVYIDGFDYELSTRADGKEPLEFFEEEPEWHRSSPELAITRFALQPRWKNGGTTLTRNMTIQVDWRAPPGPVPPSEYSYRSKREPFFLAPMAIERGEVIEIPSAAAIVNWSMKPMGLPPFILIWGRADYEDVFGTPHFVEWCYRLRLSRPIHKERMTAQFVQWGDYNRSD
jgi:hypothetical protein